MVTLTSADIMALLKKNGLEPDKVEFEVVERLREKNLKVATAESCTGGLISERITRVSGASEVFDCGVCSYANEIKEKDAPRPFFITEYAFFLSPQMI